MKKLIANIHSLLLPIEDGQLLLPNAAVAEIVEYRTATPWDGMPQWCLGKVNWRGREIPLVSYEAFVGGEAPSEASRMRIAVLNTLNGNNEVPFIGVVLRGIPRLLTAGTESVSPAADSGQAEGVLARVQAADESALIPDIDALERSVLASNAA